MENYQEISLIFLRPELTLSLDITMDIYLYLFQISTSVLSLICLDVLTPVITQTVLTRVLVLKGSGLTQTGRLVEVNTCNCHLNIQITFDNNICPIRS